jgi:excisionase family DNA binding protein
MSTEYLTVDEVAERLRVSKGYIWRLAKAGQLPATRLSPRKMRFRATDIDAWIAGKTEEPRVAA